MHKHFIYQAMKRKIPVFKNIGQIPVSEDLKTEVLRRLKTISADTLLGIAYRNFSNNISVRPTCEYQELLYEMFSEIQQNPTVIKQVLGSNFDFFARLFFQYHETQKCKLPKSTA